MSSLTIRPAVPSDAAACADIYKHYVDKTPITFELSPAPSADEMASRMASAQEKHCWLVAEEPCASGDASPRILGYANGASMNKRAAYRWSAFTGIYLSPDPSVRGRGVGTRLYQALIDALEERGYRQLVGIVSQPNDASNRLHETLGFERCSVLKRSGFKLGQWWDVWWFQRSTGDDWEHEPKEIQ